VTKLPWKGVSILARADCGGGIIRLTATSKRSIAKDRKAISDLAAVVVFI